MALARWKARRVLQALEAAKGNGTSLITLLIPPGGDKLAKTSRMLTEEAGAASCIKSRVNR